MKKLWFAMMLCFLAMQVQAKGDKKKKDKFRMEIDSVNYLLAIYDTLSPFNDQDQLIGSIQLKLTEKLLFIFNDKKVTTVKIDELIKGNSISISKSADSRLFFISIPENTGGSFRSNITIIHYRLRDSTVRAELFGDPEEGDAMNTSGYGEPYLMDSASSLYFVLGSVTTCNTCIARIALTIQLDSSTHRETIVEQYDGRYYDLVLFEYEPLQQSFYVDYFAADGTDTLYGNSETIPGLRQHFKSKYRFVNFMFLEVESCVFWEPPGK